MRSWKGLALVALVSAASVLTLSSLTSRPAPASADSDLIPGRFIVLVRDHVDAQAFAIEQGRRLGFTHDVVYQAAVNGFASNYEGLLPAVTECPACRAGPHGSYLDQMPTGVNRMDVEDNAAAASTASTVNRR
jgi:hypothetical protein